MVLRFCLGGNGDEGKVICFTYVVGSDVRIISGQGIVECDCRDELADAEKNNRDIQLSPEDGNNRRNNREEYYYGVVAFIARSSFSGLCRVAGHALPNFGGSQAHSLHQPQRPSPGDQGVTVGLERLSMRIWEPATANQFPAFRRGLLSYLRRPSG